MKKHILSLMTAVLLLIILSTTIASALDFGDLDGIGGITALDARFTLRASVGLETLTAEQKIAADVKTDGQITAEDARLILRAAVGLETLHTHSYTGAVTKAATCTANGVETFTCSCGDSYTEAIPATGHKEVKDAAKAATCTATGLTEGKHCSVCGTVLVKQQTVAKKAHTEVKIAAKAATCTATGLTEGKRCSVCGTVTVAQKTTNALGHKYVGAVTSNPTCTKTGTKTYTCQNNSAHKYTEEVPAKGHNIIIDKAVAATCTKTGLTAGQHCSRCDEATVAQEIVPLASHTEVTDTAVAATCTKTGLTEGKHCSVCDKILVPQEVTETIAHEYYDANCVEPEKCKTCGDTQGEIDKNNHKNIVTDEAKEASCTETGLTEGSHCEACDEELVKQDEIPMTSHTGGAPTCSVSAICDVCGTEYLDKDNHVEFIWKEVPASCTLNGYAAEHCTACTYFKTEGMQKGDDATGHDFGDTETVHPTCTEQGYDIKVCSECEADEKSNFIPATGHDYIWQETKPATCKDTGLRNGECSICHDRIENDVINLTPCMSFGIDVIESGSRTEHNIQIIKCTVCEKEQSRTEMHQFRRLQEKSTLTCTTDQVYVYGCWACDYTEERITIPTEGHKAEKSPESYEPTCETAGLHIYSGECLKCHEILDSTEVVIPARGHIKKEGTMQTCTTAELCATCNEPMPGKDALGHDFNVPASAFNLESVEHFFCNRCGTNNKNPLDIFNTIANNIKTNSYFTSTRSNKIYTASKTSTNMTYSRFDFGIFNNEFRKEFENMSNEPDRYTRLSTTGTLTRILPIQSMNTVSSLTAQDIENITVEKLNGINIGNVLSEFNPTNQQHIELLRKYKETSISGDIIKVTINVKDEKYNDFKDKPDTKTALSKAYSYDIVSSAKLALQDFENANDMGSEDIKLEVLLKEFTTDAKITYYFKADTFDPIIALYDIGERAEIKADISIPLGLINFNGGFDPDIKMTTTTVYIFPYLFS